MDRLSSILTAFRPRAVSVKNRIFMTRKAHLPLSAGSSYWLYLVSGEISFDREGMSSITLKEGDGTWLPKGGEVAASLPENQQASGDTAQLFILEFDFDSKVFNPLLDSQCQWITVSAKEDTEELLLPLMTLLLTESSQPRCGSQVVLERLSEAYLVQLLRLLMRSKKIEVGLLAGLSDVKLARAIVAIHEAPQKPWKVAGLAEEAGMSRSVFSNAFKQKMGVTPMSYLTSWRMGLAVQRIQRGDTNLSILSDELGYQSEAAFRRTFKKTLGVSPRNI